MTDTDPTVPDFDEQARILAQIPRAPLHERMGIEIHEARPDRVVGVMPVDGNTQPYGLLHGGASCVLAEGLGSYAAALHALTISPQHIAVGIDINATHHRAVRTGVVTGVATPIHRGQRTATYDVAIVDDQGRRVCSARLTCLLQPGTAGAVA